MHFLKAAIDDRNVDIRSLLMQPYFVYKTMKLPKVLNTLKSAKQHLAVVTDEYSGTLGVISMEDVLEQIVGEIQDEYDQEAPEIQKLDDGSYMVQGSISLEDLSEALGYEFESDDAESLGGLVLILSGSFPEEGEVFTYGGWNIQVVALEEHRITLLNLRRTEETYEQKTDSEE